MERETPLMETIRAILPLIKRKAFALAEEAPAAIDTVNDKARLMVSELRKIHSGSTIRIWIDILEAATGLPLKKEYERSNPIDPLSKLGLVVVPIHSNPNGHNYTMNEPCLIIQINSDDGPYALRMNGTMGNHLPPTRSSPGETRRAITEEVDSFFRGLKIENVTQDSFTYMSRIASAA